MNKLDEKEKEREKVILLKELGEKAERAAEFALKESERQDAVLEKELEWLAHSQFKVNEFFNTLDSIDTAGLGRTGVVGTIPMDVLITEMEGIRSVIEKRKAGCLNCIRDHQVCVGPLGRRCNRCTQRKIKCSRSTARQGKTTEGEVAVHDSQTQGAPDTSSNTETADMISSGNSAADEPRSNSILDTNGDEPPHYTVVEDVDADASTSTPIKGTIGQRKRKVSMGDGTVHAPQSKKIRWEDLESANSRHESKNSTANSKIIVDRKLWEDVRITLKNTAIELEKLQGAIRVIEQQK